MPRTAFDGPHVLLTLPHGRLGEPLRPSEPIETQLHRLGVLAVLSGSQWVVVDTRTDEEREADARQADGLNQPERRSA